jgi:hypothetical protein
VQPTFKSVGLSESIVLHESDLHRRGARKAAGLAASRSVIARFGIQMLKLEDLSEDPSWRELVQSSGCHNGPTAERE